MRLIRLLIVDDEAHTRHILHNHIPWSDLGIERVETAQNGLAALEAARRHRPDVLLCDVRMPKMDGIELAKRIRELYPACKIVFLSGFSDKEYLKSAIHLQAISYIEKPINLKEVQAVIGNAVSQHLRETEHGPSRQRTIIREWVYDGVDPTATMSNRDKGGFTLAGVYLLWKEAAADKEKNKARRCLLLAAEQHLSAFSADCLAGFAEDDLFVVLLADDSAMQEATIRAQFQQFLNDALQQAGSWLSLSVGVAHKVKRGLVPHAFKQAEDAARLHFYLGGNRIFFAGDHRCGRFEIDPNKYQWFRNRLKTGALEEATRHVRKLTDMAIQRLDNDIDRVKNAFFKHLLIILEVAAEQNLIDLSQDNGSDYLWKDMESIHSLQELSAYVLSNLEAIFDRITEYDAVQRKIYEIKTYIRTHFADKELTVQAVADQIGYSETYLCAFFKKNAGQTVKEFITEVRLDQAKQLLADGGKKLFEVAVSVGFADPNYFATAFKKRIGFTPSEYRERGRQP